MGLPHVVVNGFVPLGVLPDLSPYVCKVIAYLEYQGWPYTLQSADLRKAPRGKFPFVVVNGKTITDSDNIITELEKIHPAPLGLDDTKFARGTGKAVQSMLEHHLYFLAVKDRWGDMGCWPTLKPALVNYLSQNGIPIFLAGILASVIRKQVDKSTAAQGVGRMPAEERAAHAEAILTSLETVLEDKPFFGGDKPARVDFTAMTMLRGYSINEFDSPLSLAIRSRPRLTAYVENMLSAIRARAKT